MIVLEAVLNRLRGIGDVMRVGNFRVTGIMLYALYLMAVVTIISEWYYGLAFVVLFVAGDRVLVKNQTTTSQNGIYVVAAGAWTRALDADTSSKIASAIVAIDSGTVNGGNYLIMILKQQIL